MSSIIQIYETTFYILHLCWWGSMARVFKGNTRRSWLKANGLNILHICSNASWNTLYVTYFLFLFGYFTQESINTTVKCVWVNVGRYRFNVNKKCKSVCVCACVKSRTATWSQLPIALVSHIRTPTPVTLTALQQSSSGRHSDLNH